MPFKDRVRFSESKDSKDKGLSPLDIWFQSAKKGDVETLCRLLDDKTITKVDVQDINRRTALYLAARRGKKPCVTALLELGADPNSPSIRGTPAHAAVEGGHVACLGLLLRQDANLEALNQDRKTVLQFASKKIGRRTISILLKEIERLKKKDRASVGQQTSKADEDEDGPSGCGMRAPVPQVLSLEVESYEQHVYVHGPSSFYIKGKLRGGHVTLKRYRWEVKKEVQQELFKNEVTVLSDLRHPNVLLLMAVCYSPAPLEQGLVLEPVERDFLNKLVYKEKELLDEDTVLGICRDVACAMQYVHRLGYIHCCLGSQSVVLTEDFSAKICNFEHAQQVTNDDNSGYPISHLEELYERMAPEQLSGKPADQSGDVFSFGILVAECITRKKTLKDVRSLMKVTRKSEPRWPKFAAKWSQTLKILIGDCLQPADKRPTFVQIYDWLSSVVTSQFVCVRPSGVVIQEQDNLFPIK